MWEDGFCRPRMAECLEDMDGEDPVRKAFSKMSIQLYNYGEGWVLGRCSRVQFSPRRSGRRSPTHVSLTTQQPPSIPPLIKPRVFSCKFPSRPLFSD